MWSSVVCHQAYTSNCFVGNSPSIPFTNALMQSHSRKLVSWLAEWHVFPVVCIPKMGLCSVLFGPCLGSCSTYQFCGITCILQQSAGWKSRTTIDCLLQLECGCLSLDWTVGLSGDLLWLITIIFNQSAIVVSTHSCTTNMLSGTESF